MQIKTTGWYSHLSIRLAPIKKLDYTWVWQDVRKGSHTRLLNGQTQTAPTQDNPTVSIKVTDVRAPWLTIPCLRIIGTYGEWLPYKSIVEDRAWCPQEKQYVLEELHPVSSGTAEIREQVKGEQFGTGQTIYECNTMQLWHVEALFIAWHPKVWVKQGKYNTRIC